MHPIVATVTFAEHFIRAFSWMLLHSLWIGLLAALLTGMMLALSGNANAAKRYNLVLINLMLLVAGCAGTFLWEWRKVAMDNILHLGTPAATHNPLTIFSFNLDGLKQLFDSCLGYFSANAPTIMLIWFIFFVYRSVKMIGGVVYIHRARRRLIFNPGAEWTARMETLCKKLGIGKAVTLLESGYVRVPMVIGSLKPVILIPVGMLAGIPAGQVEAILLHELAHIRRHDYLVNLLQAVAETVFFFNPGLLWISSLLREERENCCDDIALGQTKNKREFVQALISFREHSLYGGQYQVAFPGRKNQLLNRASRIISNKNRPFGAPEKASFTAGVIILIAVLSTAAVTGAESVRKSIFRSPVATTKQQADAATISKSIAHPVLKAANHKPGLRRARVINATSTSVSLRDSLDYITDVKESQVVANGLPDKLQGDRDHEEARKDQAQALRDQDQAKMDQAQALRDQTQAKHDQAQASKDQEQARRDQDQAQREKNRQDAAQQQEQNQAQARRNEEQQHLNEMQARKNQEQAERNEKQAKLNKLQEKRNETQAIANASQAIKNQEQARLNDEHVKRNQEKAEKSTANIEE